MTPPPLSVSTPPDFDFLSTVNPQLRPALLKMTGTYDISKIHPSAQSYKMFRAYQAPDQPLLALPTVREERIPGPPGAPPVRVYVAGDQAGASRPAVLDIHGGGFIAGLAADLRRELQDLVLRHNCVAVSVDYRLAPETQYPGSLEDNYAALRWMHTHAETLGIDVKRIAVMGGSAGGGHAAALAIVARDRGEFPICMQVLIYPMLDDRTGSTHLLEPFFGHFVWTPAFNVYGWTSLLGMPAGSAEVPVGAVPARNADLKGLPPAFIGVGSIDLFAPEDIQYAARLLDAGVQVELQVVPGAYHGFNGAAPNAEVSKEFGNAWHAALDRSFQVESTSGRLRSSG